MKCPFGLPLSSQRSAQSPRSLVSPRGARCFGTTHLGWCGLGVQDEGVHREGGRETSRGRVGEERAHPATKEAPTGEERARSPFRKGFEPRVSLPRRGGRFPASVAATLSYVLGTALSLSSGGPDCDSFRRKGKKYIGEEQCCVDRGGARMDVFQLKHQHPGMEHSPKPQVGDLSTSWHVVWWISFLWCFGSGLVVWQWVTRCRVPSWVPSCGDAFRSLLVRRSPWR